MLDIRVHVCVCVCSQDDDGNDVEEDPDITLLHEIAEGPTAMKDKELRSMKDQLLIETTQLLGVC